MKSVLLRLLAVFGLGYFLVLLVGCQPTVRAHGEPVKVSRVVSGQILEILDPTGQTALTERVRLLGIETPVWKQKPWSEQAKAQLETLIGEDRTVSLESDVEQDAAPDQDAQNGSQANSSKENDSKGNDSKVRLAYVWNGDKLLNEQLVEGGFALAKGRSPNTKYEQRLERAQEKARLLGIGIWNPSYPLRQTPEEFRLKE